MFDDRVDAWLQDQVGLNPREIELGLDRVRDVWRKLGSPDPAPVKIVVGGTNGKGSCVALLEAILLAGGFRVGSYSSPHLHRYAERIHIGGCPVNEDGLLAALQATAAARQGVALTYFELGTLAALEIFAAASLDVVVLEVGLGGRLDAVNIVDADVSLVTTIDLDHQDWLGADREAIGVEKAGIFRTHSPAVCGDAHPPESLLRVAREQRVDLRLPGRDFTYHVAASQWHWRGRRTEWTSLLLPALPGRHQIANAASVLACLEALADRMSVDQPVVCEGLARVRLPGRFEVLRLGAVTWVLDVAHNPAAARQLTENLETQITSGRTVAVLGMLSDKDAAGVVDALAGQVAVWFLAGLSGARGLSGEALRDRVVEATANAKHLVHADVEAALRAAAAAVQPGDRVVILGSFVTVGLAKTWLDSIEPGAHG